GRLCQVSAAASAGSNPVAGTPNAVAPRTVLGRLPQCQLCSSSEMERPASASNSSTKACPAWLGLGFETATSAATLTNDGASVCTPGSAFAARVSHSGWKCNAVLRPPTKL